MPNARCLDPATLQLGVCTLATARPLSPVRLALEVEARGLDIVMLSENSHMPVARRGARTGRRWQA
jgi:hypothetical protein